MQCGRVCRPACRSTRGACSPSRATRSCNPRRSSRTSPTTGPRFVCGLASVAGRLPAPHTTGHPRDGLRRASAWRPSTPPSCVTCTLFGFCRDELRRSSNPAISSWSSEYPSTSGRTSSVSLTAAKRTGARPHPSSPTSSRPRPASVVDRSAARRPRRASPARSTWWLRSRTPPALGLHGLAVQRVSASGRSEWADVGVRGSSSPEHAPCGDACDREGADGSDARDAEGRQGRRHRPCTWSFPTRSLRTCWCRSPITWRGSSSAVFGGSGTRKWIDPPLHSTETRQRSQENSARWSGPPSRSCSRRTAPEPSKSDRRSSTFGSSWRIISSPVGRPSTHFASTTSWPGRAGENPSNTAPWRTRSKRRFTLRAHD